jgi:predicted O-linked N-acetylglucosamine transferase (SPINDLY family)
MHFPNPSSTSPEAALKTALQYHVAGDLARAETDYRRILAATPGNGNAWNLLGVLLHQTGRLPEATEALSRATQLLPVFADAHSNRAMVAIDAGDFETARQALDRALSINSAHRSANTLAVRLLHARGKAHLAQGSGESCAKALDDFSAARRKDPTNLVYALAVANTLRRLGRLQEALPAYRQAVALAPGQSGARVALATALREAGQWAEALDVFRDANSLDPSGKHAADASQGVGVVLMEIGRVEEALPYLQQAVELTFAQRAPTAASFHSTYLGALSYCNAIAAETILTAHREWSTRHAKCDSNIPEHRETPSRHAPWRIGFLSADLRDHPVACFLSSWLPHMTGRPYELLAYSDTAIEDATSKSLSDGFSHWRRVRDLSDAQLAEHIAADDLDLLIDLSGHTAPNRLPALATKPARRMWHWIGYPATTGMAQFDGRVTDQLADPIAETDGLHTERLIRMPGCFLCYAPPPEVMKLLPGTQAATARNIRRENGFVFGSFNNLSKLTDRVIAVWASILTSVPDSRLLLKSRVLDDARVADDVRQRFAERGIAPSRMELRGFSISVVDHFRDYDTLDLALDPFPYNGTTTTCDALWMGVPVLTLRGSRHAGRVGASLIAAALGDKGSAWVADDESDYIARAVAAAGQGKRTCNDRMSLRAEVEASPLLDGAAYAAKLDKVWRDVFLQADNGGAGKALAPEAQERSRGTPNAMP